MYVTPFRVKLNSGEIVANSVIQRGPHARALRTVQRIWLWEFFADCRSVYLPIKYRAHVLRGVEAKTTAGTNPRPCLYVVEPTISKHATKLISGQSYDSYGSGPTNVTKRHIGKSLPTILHGVAISSRLRSSVYAPISTNFLNISRHFLCQRGHTSIISSADSIYHIEYVNCISYP